MHTYYCPLESGEPTDSRVSQRTISPTDRCVRVRWPRKSSESGLGTVGVRSASLGRGRIG